MADQNNNSNQNTNTQTPSVPQRPTKPDQQRSYDNGSQETTSYNKPEPPDND